MKKLLSILLVIVMLCSIFAGLHIYSNALSSSGSCGKNVTYDFDETIGHLIISGTGKMTGYTSEGSSPFYNQSGIRSITINEGVTSIGDYAFLSCDELACVELPKTLTSIGGGAFQDCIKIKQIALQEGLQYLGMFIDVFKNCNSLTNLFLPKSISKLNKNIFYGCSSFSEIDYAGSDQEWAAITLSGTDNEFFSQAMIKYNMALPSDIHDYDEGVVTTHPTCVSTGEKTFTCKECGFKVKETVATNTEHTVVIDEAVEATCTEPGYTQGSHCESCNKVLIAQKTIPARGHNYTEVIVAPSCTEPGYTEHICSRCGDTFKDEYTDQIGHSLSSKVIPATSIEGGYTLVECSVCGYTQKTDFTDPIYSDGEWVKAKDLKIGDVVQLGTYPQSLVEDRDTIEALNLISCNYKTFSSKNWREFLTESPWTGHWEWNAKVDGRNDYIYYDDITYKGSRYRKVVMNTYRNLTEEIVYWNGEFKLVGGLQEAKPYEPNPNRPFLRQNKYQIENGYKLGTYYFKWEPINWVYKYKEVHSDKDGVPILSNSIISASMDINDIVFNEVEKDIVQEATRNYARIPLDPDGHDYSEDKDFITSRISGLYYTSFDNPCYPGRGTDYAKCLGLKVADNGYSPYWLRTIFYDERHCGGYRSYVDSDLYVKTLSSVNEFSSFSVFNTQNEYYSLREIQKSEPEIYDIWFRSGASTGNYNSIYSDMADTQTFDINPQIGMRPLIQVERDADVYRLFTDEAQYPDNCVIKNGVVFNSDITELIKFNNPKITEFVVPSSVVSIDEGAFLNSHLKRIVITDNNLSIKNILGDLPSDVIVFAYADSNAAHAAENHGLTVEYLDNYCCLEGNHLASLHGVSPMSEPTCSQNGSTGYYCLICNELAREVFDIPACGHTFDEGIVIAEATCTQNGIKRYVCSVCNETWDEFTEPTEHKWDTGTTLIYPTCTEDGIKRFECLYCHETKENVLPKKEHAFVEIVEGCIKQTTCSNTDDRELDKNTYPESEHTYSANVNKTWNFEYAGAHSLILHFSQQTKTESTFDNIYLYDKIGNQIGKYSGEMLSAQTISIDGDAFSIKLVADEENQFFGFSFDSIVAKLGKCDYYKEEISHDFFVESEIPASCTQDGSKVYRCSKCMVTMTEAISAFGHTPAEAVREKEIIATCLQAGSYDEVVYCSICNAEISRKAKTIPASGSHTLSEAVIENETPATCIQAGSYDEVVYCSVCEAEISRETKTIPASGSHTPAEAVRENEVPATCTHIGTFEEVIYCSVCGEELSREPKQIELLPHNYSSVVTSPTCTHAGYTTYTCEECGYSYIGDFTERADHTYKDTVVEPTTESQGYTVHTCTVCGYSYVDSITDILPSEMHYIIPSLEEINATLTIKSNENEYSVTSANGVFELDNIKGDVYRVYASQKNSLTVCIGEYDTKNGEFVNNDVVIPVGNVNGDDVIDLADLSLLLASDNYGKQNSDLDLTGDNQITVEDISLVLQSQNFGAQSVPIV